MQMFPDTDPEVLYNMYCMVGENKEMLIECMLNGGVIPNQEEQKEEEAAEDDFNGIIDIDDQADPAVIQRQIEMIERAN